jgi:hypothetical protein
VNIEYRDKGGRILKGGKWRVFNFVVEVAVESPKSVDEAEAAEDAAEFIGSIGRTQGRVHESYVSVVKTWELEHAPPSYKRSADSVINSKKASKPTKAKPKKVVKSKKKKIKRY